MSKFTTVEINDLYNSVVSNYLSSGYKLFPLASMSEGKFSGEVSHIDLYNKNDKDTFIRVWMLLGSERFNDRRFCGVDTLKIEARRFAIKDRNTRWPDTGELVSSFKFYQIKYNAIYTDSKEELYEIDELRNKRYDNRYPSDYLKCLNKTVSVSNIPAKVIDGIMRRVNANYGCKRATASCIKEVRLYKSTVGYGDSREKMMAHIKWEFKGRSGHVYFK